MHRIIPKKPFRIYADTSVFGGIGDEIFRKPSVEFFRLVSEGSFDLVLSPVLEGELKNAPEEVRSLYDEVAKYSESAEINDHSLTLRDEYLKAGIVTPKWRVDALHVAIATVYECSVIVSWNFKHIVNFRKIALYNGVNIINGYRAISIHTPQEVIGDEK